MCSLLSQFGPNEALMEFLSPKLNWLVASIPVNLAGIEFYLLQKQFPIYFRGLHIQKGLAKFPLFLRLESLLPPKEALEIKLTKFLRRESEFLPPGDFPLLVASVTLITSFNNTPSVVQVNFPVRDLMRKILKLDGCNQDTVMSELARTHPLEMVALLPILLRTRRKLPLKEFFKDHDYVFSMLSEMSNSGNLEMDPAEVYQLISNN